MSDIEKDYPEQLYNLLNEIIEEDMHPRRLSNKLVDLSNMKGSSTMEDNQRLLDVLMMKKNHEINKTLKWLTVAVTILTIANVVLVAFK